MDLYKIRESKEEDEELEAGVFPSPYSIMMEAEREALKTTSSVFWKIGKLSSFIIRRYGHELEYILRYIPLNI